MWTYPKCRERLAVSWDICWKCGTAPDGTEDPDFKLPEEPPEDVGEADDEDDEAEICETPLLKQFGTLTPKDFANHPVWVNCHLIDYDEPWFEETDEATYRPWLEALPVDPGEWSFVVRAMITFANGTTREGFVTPSETANDLGRMQPIVFSESGEQFSIWQGIVELSDEDRQRFYAAIGYGPAEVFPLRFAAQERLATGHTNGVAKGFYRLKKADDWMDPRAVEIFTWC